MPAIVLEIEAGLELGGAKRLGHFGILAEDLLEVSALLPTLHRISLNRVVSLKTPHALVDELEQHGRGEDQALRAVKILFHSLGIDVEAVEHAADAVEHEVEQDRRVRQRDALDRG